MRVVDRWAVCSACLQSKTVPHVDFDAVFDGPVLDMGGNPVSVDDLVVCQDCVRDAVTALELSVNPVEFVTRQRDEAIREARAWKAYAEGLEEAQAERPEPIRRGPGRPPRRAERPEEKAA